MVNTAPYLIALAALVSLAMAFQVIVNIRFVSDGKRRQGVTKALAWLTVICSSVQLSSSLLQIPLPKPAQPAA